MSGALDVDRLQFAFTVTFHYIFPQLTMGLALLTLVRPYLEFRHPEARPRSGEPKDPSSGFRNCNR